MVAQQKQHQFPLDRSIGSTSISRSLSSSSSSLSRRSLLQSMVAATTMTTTILSSSSPSCAATTPLTLTDEQLQAIVTSDVVDRQFLVTGNLTKDIYLPTATFTDEIDTYSLEQWMQGTQKLFVGESSQVRLVGAGGTTTTAGTSGGVHVSPEAVEFRFDEDLMFRLPLSLRPVVKLSGKVVLTRDKETGLISSYREFWDQDVATVLKSAKF